MAIATSWLAVRVRIASPEMPERLYSMTDSLRTLGMEIREEIRVMF